MAVNLNRVFMATLALIIIGLVIVVIIQNKQIEKFTMGMDKNTNIVDTTLQTISNSTPEQCADACAATPSCVGATVGANTCWLKSTVNKVVTDDNYSTLRFPCELYNKSNFTIMDKTNVIGLDVGTYSLSDLQKKGYTDKSLMSIKLRDGYKITIYDKDASGGNSTSFTSNQPDLNIVVKDSTTTTPQKWSNSVTSIKVDKLY